MWSDIIYQKVPFSVGLNSIYAGSEKKKNQAFGGQWDPVYVYFKK